MDYKQLSELNKDYAEKTAEMFNEFAALFQKWKNNYPRLTMVNSIHFSVNIMMMLLNMDEKNQFPKCIEDLPEVFERFVNPIVKLKSKWGKVSSKDFVELYRKEYDKQFGDVFHSEEEKENFMKWFASDMKKHMG